MHDMWNKSQDIWQSRTYYELKRLGAIVFANEGRDGKRVERYIYTLLKIAAVAIE